MFGRGTRHLEEYSHHREWIKALCKKTHCVSFDPFNAYIVFTQVVPLIYYYLSNIFYIFNILVL